MKKLSVVLILAVAITGTIFLTSAGEEMSPEQKEQMTSIDQQVADKTSSFKAEKDAECKARALEAATIQAKSVIAANAAMAAKSGKAKVKKPVIKKPAAKPVVKTNSENKWNKGTGKDEQGSKSKWEGDAKNDPSKPAEPQGSKSKWKKGGE